MLTDILQTNGMYSPGDIQLFKRNITCRNLAKDEMLMCPGEISKSIYFLISGAIYQYGYIHEIEENVIDLHTDNDWFLCHNSFIAQKPSETYIKAFTESSILELGIESLHDLIGKSPAFLQLGKIFEQSTSRVQLFDHRLTPTQKYQFVLDNKPELLKKFPLKYIASYLKITPETLSRVRENFARGKIIS
ncbi:Crp/Fnr family transcriptional regulator [Flavihumibacter fluvii]|uniref:Crp/Fnr family transcriptional regulator n=1 Tax=Flavihumibacter fluvii TaxID=2838157 RepID=UPI001BDE9D3A|nr:Crp/Fnr family transcriptional regulator [Flavihumibacter fluvii]ULQ53206.1 Crp/Fnr family transcriptional regulator [Flavihumibacter fluvii]